MSEICDNCQHWVVSQETRYGSGDVVLNWQAPSGKGKCVSLGIETDASFGCSKHFEDSWDHVVVTRKEGAPWQHFVMIDCPECGGKGDGSRGHRCAGIGKVRLYDDGYIGDEQTRTHPKERTVASTCFRCNASVNKEWAHCPSCGNKLWIEPAKTEVVSDDLTILPPLEG